MTTVNYCLDANVLIQAWQKYYSPKFCPDFWDILIELGNKGRIFIPQMVYEEVIRSEDDLSKWIKNGKLPVRKIDEKVTEFLKEIYSKDPIHKHLVDI